MSFSRDRRQIVRSAAWAVPVAVLAAGAPEAAASCAVTITMTTPGVSQPPYTLDLRDSLNRNAAGGVLNSWQVKTVSFAVTTPTGPLTGAAITMRGDSVKDAEGNYMIGFSPSSATSGFGESAIQKTASVTTSAVAGTFTVKVSTATFSLLDCGSMPKSGTFWVDVVAGCGVVTQAFTYRVSDGDSLVACP